MWNTCLPDCKPNKQVAITPAGASSFARWNVDVTSLSDARTNKADVSFKKAKPQLDPNTWMMDEMTTLSVEPSDPSGRGCQ